jgi:hypothetical protein
MWRDLEQQVGLSGETADDPSGDTETPADSVAGVIRRRPERRSRRVFRSSYMS